MNKSVNNILPVCRQSAKTYENIQLLATCFIWAVGFFHWMLKENDDPSSKVKNIPIALVDFQFVYLIKRHVEYWSSTRHLNLFCLQQELKWVSRFNTKSWLFQWAGCVRIICACKHRHWANASWWFHFISLAVFLFLCDSLASAHGGFTTWYPMPRCFLNPICSLCAGEPHHWVDAHCCLYTACTGIGKEQRS